MVNRNALVYLLGLAIPLSILIYFKVFLAPPGDLFTDIPRQLAEDGMATMPD